MGGGEVGAVVGGVMSCLWRLGREFGLGGGWGIEVYGGWEMKMDKSWI